MLCTEIWLQNKVAWVTIYVLVDQVPEILRFIVNSTRKEKQHLL